jgi:Ribosomal protein L7/L12 C-terminal domain
MNDVSRFFLSYGLDPFIAGLIIGIIICALARVGLAKNRPEKKELLGTASPSSPFFSRAADIMTSSTSIKIIDNGVEKTLDEPTATAIMTDLAQGNKIEAIKKLRESTGMELKGAKDLIEVLEKARLGKR